MVEPSDKSSTRTSANYFSSNGTILLLDSDSVMQAALRDALENAGYLVVSAGDLGDAVDRLGEVCPDLLIIRPYINSMPGRVAANYLRSKCPGLPVLIVAGFLDDIRINTQNAVERFYTFPQPFEPSELLSKIKDLMILIRKTV
jgi:DNA-binding response OmpR family regulator